MNIRLPTREEIRQIKQARPLYQRRWLGRMIQQYDQVGSVQFLVGCMGDVVKLVSDTNPTVKIIFT